MQSRPSTTRDLHSAPAGPLFPSKFLYSDRGFTGGRRSAKQIVSKIWRTVQSCTHRGKYGEKRIFCLQLLVCTNSLAPSTPLACQARIFRDQFRILKFVSPRLNSSSHVFPSFLCIYPVCNLGGSSMACQRVINGSETVILYVATPWVHHEKNILSTPRHFVP